MKIGRLVNKKVMITFICSMLSLLTLSGILSQIDTNNDITKVTASVYEVKAKEEKKTKGNNVKVDKVETYSKNSTLTVAPIIEEEPETKEETAVKNTEVSSPAPEITQTQTITVPVQGKNVYQDYAYSQFGNFGWTAEDFEALVNLWTRESNWNPNAHSSSGAHGIAQALPASKMSVYGDDYLTNYVTQINWGLNYISSKYGNPTTAWNNFLSKGWY